MGGRVPCHFHKHLRAPLAFAPIFHFFFKKIKKTGDWLLLLIKKLIKSNTYYSYIRASALNFCIFFKLCLLVSESHWPTATLRASCERLALGACNPWDCYGSKLAETLAAMFEGAKCPQNSQKPPPDGLFFLPPTPARGEQRASGAHFLPRLYPLDRILIL